MEQSPFYYVRDTASRVAHHWDYEGDNRFKALCGHRYTGDIAWHGEERPERVCRPRQERLPVYEARWWRSAAHQADNERAIARYHLDLAEKKVRTLEEQLKRSRDRPAAGDSRKDVIIEDQREEIARLTIKCDNQRRQLKQVQAALANRNRTAPK